MAIRFMYASEKTNSYRPTPWAWSTDPFPAFRGAGQRYNAFLAVANGFEPRFNQHDLSASGAISDSPCKVITTKKGTKLLVPCEKSEDEKILLITARGGFRGGFGEIEGVGAEILWQNGMKMHCCPVAHIIARITEPDGYVRTETGRRCSHGYTEVYSWKGGYFGMDTDQYDAAVEVGNLFASHDTVAADLARCEDKAQAESKARTGKAGELGDRMEAVNVRLKAVGSAEFVLGEAYFDGRQYYMERMLYTEENIKKAEDKATETEEKARMHKLCTEWTPKFKEATAGYTFTDGKDSWGNSMPCYYSNCVTAWSVAKDQSVRYEFNAEGLAQFAADAPAYEEEYQSKQRAKAKANAERIAREKAEEAERLAREHAAKEKTAAYTEAAEIGLPSNIRIWHRSGATNAGQGWVITPKGIDRDCDWMDTSMHGSNSKRNFQSYEGDHVWRQILPGEVVLSWSHAFTAAEHEFKVIYRPETLTEAQKERIAEIQQGLENAFFGKTGLTGTRSCPSIGKGWNLF